jgi:hypothetical protein
MVRRKASDPGARVGHFRLAALSRRGSVGKVTEAILAIASAIALAAPFAHGQAPSPPISVNRELLDDAWWTGPMLAPSAATLPGGHLLFEPYFYDVTTEGEYASHGARRSAPHSNGFGSLTYMLYGLADRLTVGAIPTGGYNDVSDGPNSSSVELGDLSVQTQYRLTKFHKGSWFPTTSLAVEETLPTGRYDRLGRRLSNGLGAGAYTTTLALYSQTYFWLPNGRIVRMRFNVTESLSNHVNVAGASVYGTTAGFRGHASPGSSSYGDAAWEYSLTKNWVLALDATYRYRNNTRVKGIDVRDPAPPVVEIDSGSSDAIGFAPALEYNFNRKLGILLGTRFMAAGRNTPFTVTPAIAINFVR